MTVADYVVEIEIEGVRWIVSVRDRDFALHAPGMEPVTIAYHELGEPLATRVRDLRSNKSAFARAAVELYRTREESG